MAWRAVTWLHAWFLLAVFGGLCAGWLLARLARPPVTKQIEEFTTMRAEDGLARVRELEAELAGSGTLEGVLVELCRYGDPSLGRMRAFGEREEGYWVCQVDFDASTGVSGRAKVPLKTCPATPLEAATIVRDIVRQHFGEAA